MLKHQKVKDNYVQYVIRFLEESAHDEPSIDPDILRSKINQEIDKLPPRCAEIFKLSRFEGLKYQEIAEHLDISIKTVEVQMGKALKVLRERLKDLRNTSGPE
jgi:RNA polymerase sigma-70 factor (ECF subfamily)